MFGALLPPPSVYRRFTVGRPSGLSKPDRAGGGGAPSRRPPPDGRFTYRGSDRRGVKNKGFEAPPLPGARIILAPLPGAFVLGATVGPTVGFQ